MSALQAFDGWSTFGIGEVQTAFPVALSTTRAVVNVRVPAQAQVSSIEARLNTLAGGAATITLASWRDAAADRLYVGNAAQAITTGTTTATRGGAAWAVERDHHPVGTISTVAQRIGWPQEQYVDLYFTLALDAGTSNLDGFTVNWRA